MSASDRPDALERLELGLIQAELVWQDAAANRAHLECLMDQLPGRHLYVLPETFSTGFLGDRGLPAEDLDGPTLAWMREQARARSAALAGSLVIESDGERSNRFLVVDEAGIQGQYDKRHLFGFGGEDQRYRAGDRRVALDWRGWRIDLQVCFDLRFPVWCRNDRGFDVQLFVANWPAPRVAAWRALLQARAIENQAYVIGINRTGRDGNDVAYPGKSSAWDMAGQCLAELGDRPGVAGVTLERSVLDDYRRQFPFLAEADRFEMPANLSG